MVKATVLYGPPTDASVFEDHYAKAHVPLVGKMQDVQRFEASRVVGTPDGSEPPFYRMAELWFDSAEQMQGSLGSEEGRAVVDDMGSLATGGVTVLISEVD